MRMTDDEARDTFKRIRWESTAGEPYCPHCGCLTVYTLAETPPRWKCSGCRRKFSLTSGTLFHSRKLAVRDYLASYDTGSLAVTFDPANFLVNGFDALASLAALSGKVAYTHARDARTATVSGGAKEVLVGAGDQRSYVSFGHNAAKERAFQQTLASFNSEGKTIEWRIERLPDGKTRPFATILRWNTTTLDKDDNNVSGQVLVVTRLGPGGVCHVGYVDGRANPNANELAVQIADNHARGFKCGKHALLGLVLLSCGKIRLR